MAVEVGGVVVAECYGSAKVCFLVNRWFVVGQRLFVSFSCFIFVMLIFSHQTQLSYL